MKRCQRKLLVIVLIVILLAVAVDFLVSGQNRNNKASFNEESDLQTQIQNLKMNESQSVKIKYYYPMSDYANRIRYRWFGKYVTSADVVPDCGAVFTGYHDADDLEVTAAERNIKVPVIAIAEGSVKQISYVSGYGGLLVLAVKINGQDYTVYYGHINLASSPVKVGEAVKAGQQLANLGEGCSSQTSGERKHLHFAIRKGTVVDVRGYVSATATLSNWVNPKDFLAALGAK